MEILRIIAVRFLQNSVEMLACHALRARGHRRGQNVLILSGQPFQSIRTGSQSNHKMAALKHGSRKFYDIPSEELSNLRSRYSFKKENNIEELLKYIDQSCIGKDVTFSGPYGARKGKLVECIVRVTLVL